METLSAVLGKGRSVFRNKILTVVVHQQYFKAINLEIKTMKVNNFESNVL